MDFAPNEDSDQPGHPPSLTQSLLRALKWVVNGCIWVVTVLALDRHKGHIVGFVWLRLNYYLVFFRLPVHGKQQSSKCPTIAHPSAKDPRNKTQGSQSASKTRQQQNHQNNNTNQGSVTDLKKKRLIISHLISLCMQAAYPRVRPSSLCLMCSWSSILILREFVPPSTDSKVSNWQKNGDLMLVN